MCAKLNNEAPNVVTETQFKVLLQNGYHAEVVSTIQAFRKQAVWYGEWIIRAVSQDRSVEKPLVPARTRDTTSEEIKFRTFKTANGLISFLAGYGFDPVHIPLQKGGRAVHVLQNGSTTIDHD